MQKAMDSVSTAFELMRLELEAAVENLNDDGAKQFRASEYEKARELSARGKALQAFCEKVKGLESEWAQSFAEDAGPEEDEQAAAHTARTILSASKASRTGLLVRFPDGSVISEKTAAETLIRVVERIGPSQVERLGILVNAENIVSRDKSIKYNDHRLYEYYIKTHSSTEQKKRDI